jgi:hypothetical protein
MSSPKTKTELAQERLREVDGRLAVVKRMLGTSLSGSKARLNAATKRMKDARGEARFVRVGGCMVEATDRLEVLLDLEQSYADIVDLDNKDPISEAEALLLEKIDLLGKLTGGSAYPAS